MESQTGTSSFGSASELSKEFRAALEEGVLKHWYPLVLDRAAGGYLTNITHDWKIAPEQEKMIVTQARHVWTTAKAADFTGQTTQFTEASRHGFEFLRDRMWDARDGGFFQIRSREGGYSDFGGWREEKRTYGNAFGIYGLAAYYRLSRDPEVLGLARKAFDWIEEHAFDHARKGYFQFLTREGIPFDSSGPYATVAMDKRELGYKDQNSSIHLLEAYTELYNVWADEVLEHKLRGLLELIRDTMVAKRGYLQLFFHPDWSPVSFRDASPEIRREHFGLDHVSFGHDYETAFLMLEASHALKIEIDARTLTVARSMLDHALANGWDNRLGGFYDGGYYEAGKDSCTIIQPTKNWWAQAEGLNALIIFSRIFPDSDYQSYFLRQWEYVKKYILDPKNGDWFEGGIDKEPRFITGPKSHIWKCTYHTGRSLMNCIALLSDPKDSQEGIRRKREELDNLIDHWRRVASAS